jgi:hypothetical protein
MFDQQIADLASDGLDFIEGRKHFWALQADGAKHAEEIPLT